MDIELLIAQWSDETPRGFVRPGTLRTGPATFCHRRC